MTDMNSKAQVTDAFQDRVQPWMMACFGPEISADKLERNDRFIEEALELVQASDYPKARALALVDYVYGRDQGEINQEVGGVMVTLAAHCLAHGVNMHEAAETELARIWTKVETIRAKQAAKPTGSALPIAALAAQEKPEPGVAVLDVDRLAQEIRRVDGNHSLGAGALAEALMPFLLPALVATQAQAGEPVAWALIHAGDIVETTFKSDDADYMREVNPNCSVVPLYLHPTPSPDLPEGEVDALTLDVLRRYHEDISAGDVPDYPLALYSYLCMDGYVTAKQAISKVRSSLVPTSPSPIDKGEVK